jgi:transcription elongation factor Elf1
MARSLLNLRRRRQPLERLELCPACESDFVSPIDWAERNKGRWWIRLRCGECGVMRDVIVPDETAQRYDLVLDHAMDVIADALRRLDRQRMAADAEAFATALRLDLLDAADFATRTGPPDGTGRG